MGDIAGLSEGSGLLSLVTNEKGGILDDTVITNAGDHVYMVVNGATKFGDMEHFNRVLKDEFSGKDVTMEYLEDSMQLLALQGPGAAAAVAKILPSGFDLTNMAFMTGTNTVLDGIEGCRITRLAATTFFGAANPERKLLAISHSKSHLSRLSSTHSLGSAGSDLQMRIHGRRWF